MNYEIYSLIDLFHLYVCEKLPHIFIFPFSLKKKPAK